MADDYVTVSLPEPIIDKIDKVIKAKGLGFQSRPEFVKDAVRRLLQDYGVGLTSEDNDET